MVGEVAKTQARFFGGRRIFEAVIAGDDPLQARLTCRWFNAPFVQRMITTGMRLVVYGRPKRKGRQLLIDHPEFEVAEDNEGIHLGRIVPIHPAGEGITARAIREIIFHALEEVLPEPSILPRHLVISTHVEAIRQIHFPSSFASLDDARRQLALEEFFSMQMIVCSRKAVAAARKGVPRRSARTLTRQLIDSLPFQLTGAQNKAISEIRQDLESEVPMARLLQGDVGSGKTLVAACAILDVVESGAQAAFMAPTQILAEQHFLNLRRLFEPLGVAVALRTSSRREGGDMPLFQGEPKVFVGTHALLFDSIALPNLGLAIIDEQHKFGVMQRARLAERGPATDLLVMTATPIPRSLALTLYGDLDLTVLDEMPADRGSLVTAVRPQSRISEAAKFIREQITAGRQAYIVYPLIEETDAFNAKSATEEFEKWKLMLAPHCCALLHGRMDAEEKERIMADFRSNRIAALVSTTVVEVGVDVPNATVMLIENAERFGLAQLHQLRGRVGRGSHKSYCILLHGSRSLAAKDKLEVLEKTRDGFEVADADLRLRGPGDMLGVAQSGLPPIRLGDLIRDADLFRTARLACEDILREDPLLAAPENAQLRAFVRASMGVLATATG